MQHNRLSYPANGSFTRAAAERLGASAMILETTTREQPLSHRTRQHRIMVHTLLSHLGMIPADAPNLVTPPKRAATVRAAIYDAGGTGGNGVDKARTAMAGIPGSVAWRVGPEDIRNGALRQFDLVVFPGGSGSKQAAALGNTGREQVRGFVADGGGFVGICAGAYLGAANYDVQKGTRTNTPAITATNFGKGPVLCISPHPESSLTLRPLVTQDIRWAAGKH